MREFKCGGFPRASRGSATVRSPPGGAHPGTPAAAMESPRTLRSVRRRIAGEALRCAAKREGAGAGRCNAHVLPSRHTIDDLHAPPYLLVAGNSISVQHAQHRTRTGRASRGPASAPSPPIPGGYDSGMRLASSAFARSTCTGGPTIPRSPRGSVLSGKKEIPALRRRKGPPPA